MAERANHHYVPQYYFKFFNRGGRQICILLKKDGRIITNAPIKSQSSRHMFYGTVEIEKAFSELEGLHAAAIRALIEAAETEDRARWLPDHYLWLLQAVAFQRARTVLEVEKVSPAIESMLLHTFSEYVKRTRPLERASEILGPIGRGEVKIRQCDTATVLRQIMAAMKSAALLVDMQPRVIRNHTDYPFIFSDSPVVFYNSYYRKITDRGVLGFQTPGLQIFLPLTPKLQLMMFDPAVYQGPCLSGPFCEVVDRSEVSRLNALQLHHSHQAVYFGDPGAAEYVKALYDAHKPRLLRPESVFRVRSDWLVKDEPGGEIMHTFEPQVPYDLSLSFIKCTPMQPRDYTFRYRRPEAVEEHNRLHPQRVDDEYDVDCA